MQLKDHTTEEIYSKFRKSWVTSWEKLLEKLSLQADLIHFHAYTAAIGPGLLMAARRGNPAIKIVASYHLPISCMKGTLLFGKTKKECRVTPTAMVCASCTISDKTNLPYFISRAIVNLLPRKNLPGLPTAARLPYLAGIFISSFRLLDESVDLWYVFSEQVSEVLLANKIEPGRIKLLRHGVNKYGAGVRAATARPVVVFLYVGRLDISKGFLTLLKAWETLEQSDLRELRVVGAVQNDNADILKAIQSVSHRTDIQFLGLKERNEVNEIMQEAQCTIIPSEWVETGPLVFHEAIAAGCDVIASNMGGCKELASLYKKKSVLFQAGSARDLSEKIKSFTFSDATEIVNSEEDHYRQVYNSSLDLWKAGKNS